jgi:hypothetical protein
MLEDGRSDDGALLWAEKMAFDIVERGCPVTMGWLIQWARRSVAGGIASLGASRALGL